MTQALSKDINYRLTADPSGINAGFKSAEKSASVFERELAKLEARQKRVDQASAQIGRGMLVAGAAIAAGLGLAARAAIQWESAWAGVAKVVEGSPEQMAALEGQLRDLAKVLPATATEIAGVAAEAGALGVARQDIAGFTKTMIDLGEATALSSTEAADGLARMMNVMQTAPENVRRLGSTLVDLGNKSAATESEILAMSLRISGAGHIVGLTEAEVLSFGAALSSVGIDAEAGGSAISRAFITIDQAVRDGGDSLDEFAQVAGVTADEFRTKFQQDAAGAITLFVEGLGRMNTAGGNVFKTLDDLGLSEIRVRDALLRLAGAGTLTAQTLEVGNRAWEDNNALTKEAERRYQTTEARIRIARNQLNDFAIDMGQTLLPVIGAAAHTVGSLADVLGDLPGPVKTALGVIAALSAALLLTGGAALVMVPKIAATTAAIDTLAASEGRLAAVTVATSRALGRAGSFLAGPWGIALAAAVTVLGAFAVGQANARARVEEVSAVLDQQTGAVIENTRVWAANELETKGVYEAAQRLGISLQLVTDAALGNQDALTELNRILEEEAGQSVEQSVRMHQKFGNTLNQNDEDVALLGETVHGLSVEFDKNGESIRRKAAATDADTAATEELEPATRLLGEAIGATGQDAKDAAKAVDDLGKELDALFGSLFDLQEAEDASGEAFARLIDQIKGAKDAGDKHAKSLDGNSKAALDNRAAVRNLIKTYFDQIQAYAESGATSDQLRAKTDTLRAAFVKQMRQAGFSEKAIADYAASFDQVPATVSTTIKANTGPAKASVDDLREILRALPRTKTVDVYVRTFYSGGKPLSQRQHGGPVRAFEMYEVGEAGREVFVSNQDGYIYNATQSRAMLDRRYDAAVAPRAVGVAAAVAAAGGSPGGWPSAADFGREVRRALQGVVVVMDGEAVGRIQGRTAFILGRS